uniref:Uncharacterized protein n=1 Tax=Cacopsylla melanoneura TaxID=428564 RepID=A0A8D8WEV0_9HEMI
MYHSPHHLHTRNGTRDGQTVARGPSQLVQDLHHHVHCDSHPRVRIHADSATEAVLKLCRRPVHVGVRYLYAVYQPVQIQPLHRVPGTSRHCRLVPQVSVQLSS